MLASAALLLALAPPSDAAEALDPAVLWADLRAALDTRRGPLRDRNDQRNLLSEVASLALELDLALGDEAGFDRDLALLETHFLAGPGLLRWRLGRPEGGFCSNASVDDLRAVRALLLAHARWGQPEHLAAGLALGRAVLDANVREGLLVDAASWSCGRGVAAGAPTAGAYLTLSFADLGALALLSAWEPRAAAVHARTAGVVLAGLLDPAGPRWGYALATGTFDRADDNPINLELHRLQLLDGLPESAATAAVCALPDETWRASGNVAHVALAARRLRRCGQDRAAGEALARLATFALPDGAWAGLLGYEVDGEATVWAFDNLQAALALAEARTQNTQ